MSHFLMTFLAFLACLAAPLRVADEEPFVKRFGAFPKDQVSQEFRLQAVQYGTMHLGAFSALGKSMAHDRKGFEDYRTKHVNPVLDQLQPKTEAEKKIKEAAVWVMDAMAFWVEPQLVPEDKREATAAFLKACVMPEEPPSEIRELSGLVTHYLAYATGMPPEELVKRAKQLQEAEKK